MKIPSILLFLTLYTGALAAQEGGCGRAGALRCDADGRHVSACTRGGAWRPVLDCAASNAACVDGRCVASSRTLAKTCSTPGQMSCSNDCAYRTACTLNNVWVEASRCPSEYICDCGECVDKATNYCRYSEFPICGKGAESTLFPNVDDCASVYYCNNEGDLAGGGKMCRDPDRYFHPCTRGCFSSSTFCDRYISCKGNEGLDAVIPGNPSLYYICANGTMFLLKCKSPTSMYDTLTGECVEIGVEYCPTYRMAVNSSFNFFTLDECESTGSTTLTTDGSTSSTDGSSTVSLACNVGDKWPDLTDECKYYLCFPPGEPVHMTCPPHSIYNITEESCILSAGSCMR